MLGRTGARLLAVCGAGRGRDTSGARHCSSRGTTVGAALARLTDTVTAAGRVSGATQERAAQELCALYTALPAAGRASALSELALSYTVDSDQVGGGTAVQCVNFIVQPKHVGVPAGGQTF